MPVHINANGAASFLMNRLWPGYLTGEESLDFLLIEQIGDDDVPVSVVLGDLGSRQRVTQCD